MKFKVISRGTTAAVIIAILLALCAFSAISFAGLARQQRAEIKVTVRDSADASYLEGATVFVLETQSYFSTDADGATGIISVPFERDNRYDSSCSKNFMEITLLVYKEGYIDYVLLHTTIYPGETKNKLILLDKKEDELTDFYIFTDAAPQSWVNEFISKYKKS